jgi:hypothetical protein
LRHPKGFYKKLNINPMKKNYAFPVLILAIFLSSCASVKVTADQEKGTDFSPYKTYSFLGWQGDSDKIMNEFDMKRMRDAFNAEFAKRDLQMVSEGADMTISLYLVVSKETSTTAYTNYNGGYGGGRYSRYGGYGWGGGSSTTTYSETDYLKGTMVMDVFDEKSGQQIWQGIVVKTIEEKPSKREKSIPYAVSALMKKFPIAPVEGK